MTTATPPKSNKNWLLVKFRQWHSWGGVFLSLFIFTVAVTGILLNHKDLFLHRADQKKSIPHGLLTPSTDLAAIPVSFTRALEIAREQYGEVPLEKIELKEERGKLAYKIARGEGQEILIDANSGEVYSKYGMSLKAGSKGMINWAKIVDDLHTGKIFGLFGKLTVDFTSLVIIALTATGIYLWAVPLYRKRQSAKNRAVQLPNKAVPSTAARDLQARLAAKVKQPAESLPQPAVALEVSAVESLAVEPLAVPVR